MQIVSTKQFDKQFKKLSPTIKNSFNKKVAKVVFNIYDASLNTHKLHGKFEGCMSINITGDFRAVFQLKDNNTLLFIAIGSHNKLYS